MADSRLRQLEREALTGGAREILKLQAHYQRAGLEIPRELAYALVQRFPDQGLYANAWLNGRGIACLSVSRHETHDDPWRAVREAHEFLDSFYRRVLDLSPRRVWDAHEGREAYEQRELQILVEERPAIDFESGRQNTRGNYDPYVSLFMVDDGEELADAEPDPDPVSIWLNAYIETRHYGGGEEGGWWFNAGQALASMHIGVASELSFNVIMREIEHANEAYEFLESYYSEVAYGNIYSSRGGQALEVTFWDEPAQHYPQERPYYE